MTPKQRIKRQLLIEAGKNLLNKVKVEITEDNLDDVWEEACGEDCCDMQDWVQQFRTSGQDTGLPSPHSRYYESREVGRHLSDNTWVGWAYWYGGGKHSEPEEIDWMSDAYELDVTSEVKTVTVLTFSKKAS